MYKSISETHKLFGIEGIESGQIDIKTSEYLLSLSEDKQIEILTDRLEDLKNDLAKHKELTPHGSNEKNEDVNEVQLQLLIQVIEGLIAKV